MAKNSSSNEKIKIRDLIQAAKRNCKSASKKTYIWIVGIGIAIVTLFIVWIGDLVNIFG